MAVLAPHRFSVEDYYRMAETGVLRPEARVELVDGQIVDRAPIGPLHGGTVNRLAQLFIRCAKDRWFTSVQNPIRLDRNSEPQPDLLLLSPAEDDYLERHPGPDDVFLLIEVADSTLAYDRSQKLPAYARAGIIEVWIVNLGEATVEVYREPNFLGYESKTIREADGMVSPLSFPDVTIDVRTLLRRAR